ncbi:mitochondrial inner membrane protein Mpv17 isoform X1 [Strix aluco]|uniref:mitochondrial inner membrane protein Mpv17 isoform X1 n=1 Tax=Strix aluco TaxID=111821 RepID=UPI003DA61277
MFPRLLPRRHGGDERSVSAGELVQDPAGLHRRAADQLLHLATSANRKLLLRAPAAQAGRRPVCCHRLELLPLLESKSDVRWKSCPLPACPACMLPDSAPPPEPSEWVRVTLGYAGCWQCQGLALSLDALLRPRSLRAPAPHSGCCCSGCPWGRSRRGEERQRRWAGAGSATGWALPRTELGVPRGCPRVRRPGVPPLKTPGGHWNTQ